MSDYTDDAYAVLGVKPDATEKEIKTAYRKLALVHHPDRQSDPAARDAATTKFAAIANAYEILSDEYLRAEYNQRTPTSSTQPASTQASPTRGTSKGAHKASAAPAPFRYHFSDPYEVFKRDFRDQFGIEYPGAKYDWVDFDVPTTAAPAPNHKMLGSGPNAPQAITNGASTPAPAAAAAAPAKKGFNPFRRNKDAKDAKDAKDENQLVVRNPQQAQQQPQQNGTLANPSCDSTALVLAEKKNNRPVSMEVITTQEGPVTKTVTIITRPDGSTEKMTMRTGIPGPAPNKNVPQLTNGETPKQLTNGPIKAATPQQKPMLQLTNGNTKSQPAKPHAKQMQKALPAAPHAPVKKALPAAPHAPVKKPLLLGNGNKAPTSTALVPAAADTKPKRKLLGWGGKQ